MTSAGTADETRAPAPVSHGSPVPDESKAPDSVRCMSRQGMHTMYRIDNVLMDLTDDYARGDVLSAVDSLIDASGPREDDARWIAGERRFSAADVAAIRDQLAVAA